MRKEESKVTHGFWLDYIGGGGAELDCQQAQPRGQQVRMQILVVVRLHMSY